MRVIVVIMTRGAGAGLRVARVRVVGVPVVRVPAGGMPSDEQLDRPAR
jgi:hypothetical protein